MNRINSGANGSLRINSRATQGRSSSNLAFKDSFRAGIKNGIEVTNSAIKQFGPALPGSAALTASLSDAARQLNSGSRLDGVAGAAAGAVVGGTVSGASVGPIAGETDFASMQEQMSASNREMLAMQYQMAEESNKFTTASNVIKVRSDTNKTIGSNIR